MIAFNWKANAAATSAAQGEEKMLVAQSSPAAEVREGLRNPPAKG